MTLPRPTDAELVILRVLWERGPSTVRHVFEVLSSERSLGYTTVLKMLQVMNEKGLVRRDDSERSHVYAAVQGESQTQQALVRDLVDKAFGGSAMQLVMQALSTRPTSKKEMEEIRKLLERAEGGGS